MQSFVQKQKSLNLGPGMSNLSILEQEFETTIVILEIIASNFSNCKVWCETKSPLPYSRWAISGLLTDGRGQRGRPISKICQTYPAMMSVGTVIPHLKGIQKIQDLHCIPLEFCWHLHFSPEISNFCYIKKCRRRLHYHVQFLILFTFLFL